MKCNYCDLHVKDEKPEIILIDAGQLSVFCSLKCLVEYISEFKMTGVTING